MTVPWVLHRICINPFIAVRRRRAVQTCRDIEERDFHWPVEYVGLAIALDISRVRVDVEGFPAHVAHARRLLERGALAEARTVLTAADRQYRADAFEDEPYADWSGPLREEARAAYLSLLRTLAQTSHATSGPVATVGYLLRMLERDPNGQPAHRALVRALVAGALGVPVRRC